MLVRLLLLLPLPLGSNATARLAERLLLLLLLLLEMCLRLLLLKWAFTLTHFISPLQHYLVLDTNPPGEISTDIQTHFD